MQFSSRLTIAIHTMLCIEMFRGECKTTSAFLAGSVNVNPVIIRNILGQLKAAGLVAVEAGVGGAALARAPEDITMLDVFEAVEEDKALFHFHENPNPNCPVGKNVHALLDDKLEGVRQAMEDSMRSVTLRSLLDQLRETVDQE